MSIQSNLLLRTTYTQQIQYLGEELQQIKDLIQNIAQMAAVLHHSHENLCKHVYKDWFAVCHKCNHEHEKMKHIEKCERCGDDRIAHSFPVV